MPEPVKNWKWTAARETAAAAVADDTLVDDEIARRAGVTRETLAAWKLTPEFATRVTEITTAAAAAATAATVSDKLYRVRVLDDLHAKILTVIAERAKEYDGAAAGSGTGLLVRTERGIGRGEDFRVVEEWTLDTATLAELRQIQKQVAQELGQWVEKSEATIKRDASDMTDEELERIARGSRTGAA